MAKALVFLCCLTCVSPLWSQTGEPAWTGDSFGQGLEGAVHALAWFDEDGPGPLPPSLFIGGDFETWGGASNLVRRTDQGFMPVGDLAIGEVFSMTVFNDGSGPALYVESRRNSPDGSLLKWDGCDWTPLGPPQEIFAMTAWDPDGGGPQRPVLAASYGVPGLSQGWGWWDGRNFVEHEHDRGESRILTLEVFGGRLYAGGRIVALGPDDKPVLTPVAEWDGESWRAVGGGPTFRTFDSTVLHMTTADLDAGGPDPRVLLVGGRGLTIPDQFYNFLHAWDGEEWTTVGVGGSPVNGIIRDSAMFDPDGGGPAPPELLLAGYNGSGSVARLTSEQAWETTAFFGVTEALLVSRDGSTRYAGGEGGLYEWRGSDWRAASRAWSEARHAIAGVWDLDGDGTTEPFGSDGIWTASGWRPFRFTLDTGGEIAFTPVQAPAGGSRLATGVRDGRTSLMEWRDDAFAIIGHIREIAGAGEPYHALTYDADGAGPGQPVEIVSGGFSEIGGTPANRIAAYDRSEDKWTALAGGFAEKTPEIAVVDPDGAGGVNPMLIGAVGNALHAWDGTVWRVLRSFNGAVFSPFAWDEDGAGPDPERLWCRSGGMFWRWDGAAWTSFDDLGSLVSAVVDFDGREGTDAPDLIAQDRVSNVIVRFDDGVWTPIADGPVWRSSAPSSGTGAGTIERMHVQQGPRSGSIFCTGRMVAGKPFRSDGIARLAACEPARIIGQPINRTVDGGDRFVLSVRSAGSPPLEHQWFKDGEPLAGDHDRICGMESPFSVVRDAEPSDAGTYSVRVTNAGGSVMSRELTVVVTCPSDITGDGYVGVLDLMLFLHAWRDGDQDFDRSGETDVLDLMAFLERYLAGC